MILLLTALSAIGLSVVTYKKLAITSPEATPVTMQLDSNNNEELSLQLDQIQGNISQAQARVNSINNDITLLQGHLDTLTANLTHILSWHNVTNNIQSTPRNISQHHNATQENAPRSTQSTSQLLQLHCGAGEWYRVAYLNMSNPTEQCPSTWQEYNSTGGVRACGRPFSTEGSCAVTLYHVNKQYNRVCGRVIGYQVASPDAFFSYNSDPWHIDGVNITHGTPPHHIWSYIAGASERNSVITRYNCPCSPEQGTGPPPFIGENYYCESGNPNNLLPITQFFTHDKLWDGQQCEGTCCIGTNTPPWFSIQLPTSVTDVIEIRICGDENTANEDTPLELIEIYVQ